MSVSFDQLKSMVVFAQVVRHGSFASAARHLNVSRAVVSYHVKRLEQQLAVKLLNRSTRSLSLTDAGEQYYQSCRLILDETEIANQRIENLRDKPQGRLKMTCSVNLGLQAVVPAMIRFRTLYPGIELELLLTDDVVDIVQEGVDLAIRGAPLVDSGLQAAPLAVMKTLLCAAPSYLQKHGRPQTPEELASHQWVYYQNAPKNMQLSRGQKQYSIVMKGAVTTNNSAARTAFVESGEGLGRIPAWDALPKIEQGILEQLLPDYQLNDINLYAVFASGATHTVKVRLVIDYLKDHFSRL